jgi:hypothetical protein
MSDKRPVSLEFLAERQCRVLSELRILRDDVGVLAAAMCRPHHSYDRLETKFGNRSVQVA